MPLRRDLETLQADRSLALAVPAAAAAGAMPAPPASPPILRAPPSPAQVPAARQG